MKQNKNKSTKGAIFKLKKTINIVQKQTNTYYKKLQKH